MVENPTSVAKKPEARIPAQGRASFSIWKAIQTLFAMGFIMATLFTMWKPENLFSNQLLEQMMLASQGSLIQGTVFPTLTPAGKQRIGIVSGHMGHDSGAVCQDGVEERKVNYEIARRVREMLVKSGYEVDLLEEFDNRLADYQALALISIHNDSCTFINSDATGFKVSAAKASPRPERSSRLTNCLIDRYAKATKMKFHASSITVDMTNYHAFDEINPYTTAVIIETGFLNLDRNILINETDKVAEGVFKGILCYVRNEPLDTQTLPLP